ncbi:hypothetical protein GCM10022376_13020 [Yimella lutea]
MRTAIRTPTRPQKTPHRVSVSPRTHVLSDRPSSNAVDINVNNNHPGHQPTHHRGHRTLTDQPKRCIQRCSDHARNSPVLCIQAPPRPSHKQPSIQLDTRR